MIPLQFALRRRMIGIQESVCFVNIPQQMIYATGEYYWGDVTYKGKTVRGPETLRVRKGDTIVLRSATALTDSGANYQIRYNGNIVASANSTVTYTLVVEHDYTITYSNVGGAVFIVTFTD